MIVISATVMPDRSVHVEVVHWPSGARDWRSRTVERKGQFMLPPCQLSRRQAVALVGEWLAREQVQIRENPPTGQLMLPL